MLEYVKITEIKEEFVLYKFTSYSDDTVGGTIGKKWFPNAKVGQEWELDVYGALILGSRLMKDA